MSNQRRPPTTRADYLHFQTVPTRWMDNDLYGHVNNVTYYSYFDTVVNRYLIEPGGLDIQNGTVIGFAVETMCRFHRPFAYPEDVEAGLRVGKLGSSSVRYELGLFGAGEDIARADAFAKRPRAYRPKVLTVAWRRNLLPAEAKKKPPIRDGGR